MYWTIFPLYFFFFKCIMVHLHQCFARTTVGRFRSFSTDSISYIPNSGLSVCCVVAVTVDYTLSVQPATLTYACLNMLSLPACWEGIEERGEERAEGEREKRRTPAAEVMDFDTGMLTVDLQQAEE